MATWPYVSIARTHRHRPRAASDTLPTASGVKLGLEVNLPIFLSRPSSSLSLSNCGVGRGNGAWGWGVGVGVGDWGVGGWGVGQCMRHGAGFVGRS